MTDRFREFKREEKSEEIIEAHRAYSSGLLRAAGVDEDKVRLHDFLYVQVWRHAVKHERERRNETDI